VYPGGFVWYLPGSTLFYDGEQGLIGESAETPPHIYMIIGVLGSLVQLFGGCVGYVLGILRVLGPLSP